MQLTSTNIQLRNISRKARLDTPPTTHPLVVMATSAIKPQMISTENYHQQYFPHGSHYDPIPYTRTYPQPKEMGNNGMQLDPQAFGTCISSQPNHSYPYISNNSQQRITITNTNQPMINKSIPYSRSDITGIPQSRAQGCNITQYQQQNLEKVEHTAEPFYPSLGYGHPGHYMQQPEYGPTRAQQFQYTHSQLPNSSNNQTIVPQIKTEQSVTCSEDHTYGLCTSCGWCGLSPPATTSSHCNGDYNSTMTKANNSNLFVPKYSDSSDIDMEESDASHGFNYLNQIRKPIKLRKKSHAAFTQRKSHSEVDVKQRKPDTSQTIPSKIYSAANNVNRSVAMKLQPNTEKIEKPFKRPICLSKVKFHESETVDLTREFDELLAELDYMEKTNKINPTIFRSFCMLRCIPPPRLYVRKVFDST